MIKITKNKTLKIETKTKSLESYLKEKYRSRESRKIADERFRRLSIGYEIYLARKHRGITQAALAKKLNTKQSVVARIESGSQNVTTDKLHKIADVLGRKLKIELV